MYDMLDSSDVIPLVSLHKNERFRFFYAFSNQNVEIELEHSLYCNRFLFNVVIVVVVLLISVDNCSQFDRCLIFVWPVVNVQIFNIYLLLVIDSKYKI